jgi:hypothetical protein
MELWKFYNFCCPFHPSVSFILVKSITIFTLCLPLNCVRIFSKILSFAILEEAWTFNKMCYETFRWKIVVLSKNSDIWRHDNIHHCSWQTFLQNPQSCQKILRHFLDNSLLIWFLTNVNAEIICADHVRNKLPVILHVYF